MHNDCPVVWVSSADFVCSDGESEEGRNVVDVRLLFRVHANAYFKAELYDESATRALYDLTDSLAVQPHRLSLHICAGALRVDINDEPLDLQFGATKNILLRFECCPSPTNQQLCMLHLTSRRLFGNHQ